MSQHDTTHSIKWNHTLTRGCTKRAVLKLRPQNIRMSHNNTFFLFFTANNHKRAQRVLWVTLSKNPWETLIVSCVHHNEKVQLVNLEVLSEYEDGWCSGDCIHLKHICQLSYKQTTCFYEPEVHWKSLHNPGPDAQFTPETQHSLLYTVESWACEELTLQHHTWQCAILGSELSDLPTSTSDRHSIQNRPQKKRGRQKGREREWKREVRATAQILERRFTQVHH